MEGDKISKEFDLTASRWKKLGATELSGNLVTVPGISRRVEQSRQAVQRLVDIMTRDELLTQVENPKHKRAKYIKLTKKGQRVYEFLYIKQIEWAKGHLVNIEKAELETALVVLRKMTL